MLRLNTSLGEVFVEVEAENVPSPYRVQPNVGRRFPLGMAVQPRVKLFNPHPEPLRITQVSTVRGVVTVHPILADGAAGVVVPPMSEREVARIVASPSQPGRVADLIRIAFRDTTLVVPFDAYFARPGVLVEPGHVDAGLGSPIADGTVLGAFESSLPTLAGWAEGIGAVAHPAVVSLAAGLHGSNPGHGIRGYSRGRAPAPAAAPQSQSSGASSLGPAAFPSSAVNQALLAHADLPKHLLQQELCRASGASEPSPSSQLRTSTLSADVPTLAGVPLPDPTRPSVAWVGVSCDDGGRGGLQLHLGTARSDTACDAARHFPQGNGSDVIAQPAPAAPFCAEAKAVLGRACEPAAAVPLRAAPAAPGKPARPGGATFGASSAMGVAGSGSGGRGGGASDPLLAVLCRDAVFAGETIHRGVAVLPARLPPAALQGAWSSSAAGWGDDYQEGAAAATRVEAAIAVGSNSSSAVLANARPTVTVSATLLSGALLAAPAHLMALTAPPPLAPPRPSHGSASWPGGSSRAHDAAHASAAAWLSGPVRVALWPCALARQAAERELIMRQSADTADADAAAAEDEGGRGGGGGSSGAGRAAPCGQPGDVSGAVLPDGEAPPPGTIVRMAVLQQVRFRNTFAATLTVESVVSSSPRVVVLAAGTRSPTHRNGGTEAVTVAVLLGAESDSAIQPAWSRHCGDDVHPASSARSGASLRASPCLSPARGFALSADVPPPAAVRASLFVNASITLPASRSAGSHTGRAALHTTSLFRFPFEGVSGQITVQAARACVWDAAFFASDVREGGPSACAHPPAGLVPALRRLERRWIDLSHADPAAGRRAGGSHDGAVERDASSRSGAVTNAKELGDGRSEVEGGAGHAGSADDDLEELDEEGEEEVWEEGQEEDGASGGDGSSGGATASNRGLRYGGRVAIPAVSVHGFEESGRGIACVRTAWSHGRLRGSHLPDDGSFAASSRSPLQVALDPETGDAAELPGAGHTVSPFAALTGAAEACRARLGAWYAAARMDGCLPLGWLARQAAENSGASEPLLDRRVECLRFRPPAHNQPTGSRRGALSVPLPRSAPSWASFGDLATRRRRLLQVPLHNDGPFPLHLLRVSLRADLVRLLGLQLVGVLHGETRLDLLPPASPARMSARAAMRAEQAAAEADTGPGAEADPSFAAGGRQRPARSPSAGGRPWIRWPENPDWPAAPLRVECADTDTTEEFSSDFVPERDAAGGSAAGGSGDLSSNNNSNSNSNSGQATPADTPSGRVGAGCACDGAPRNASGIGRRAVRGAAALSLHRPRESAPRVQPSAGPRKSVAAALAEEVRCTCPKRPAAATAAGGRLRTGLHCFSAPFGQRRALTKSLRLPPRSAPSSASLLLLLDPSVEHEVQVEAADAVVLVTDWGTQAVGLRGRVVAASLNLLALVPPASLGPPPPSLRAGLNNEDLSPLQVQRMTQDALPRPRPAARNHTASQAPGDAAAAVAAEVAEAVPVAAVPAAYLGHAHMEPHAFAFVAGAAPHGSAASVRLGLVAAVSVQALLPLGREEAPPVQARSSATLLWARPLPASRCAASADGRPARLRVVLQSGGELLVLVQPGRGGSPADAGDRSVADCPVHDVATAGAPATGQRDEVRVVFGLSTGEVSVCTVVVPRFTPSVARFLGMPPPASSPIGVDPDGELGRSLTASGVAAQQGWAAWPWPEMGRAYQQQAAKVQPPAAAAGAGVSGAMWHAHAASCAEADETRDRIALLASHLGAAATAAAAAAPRPPKSQSKPSLPSTPSSPPEATLAATRRAAEVLG
ncbi:hypothetical protein FNF29_07211 [Cafeteria roenbergensis]|uniref:TMEM131 second Ig-like domain-containing protein n=2 Tax=Cafeteria roenbergensis TaxID=33653 RepID=A0A5A8C3M6_CAFRO|nr:hypothetical protein FNF29_07211 [Cafeteria roenbergensis]|eukprot:KAA0147656.1 hypothetical protein FNF29_07211 [Cafeteria roenbergensis]